MTDSEMSDSRIEAILGEDNLDVSEESLKLYRSYLQEHIVKPCELTGSEDFIWEEFYIFGPGDKKEYDELKKTRPSYRDIYKFMSFDDLIDDMAGLMVRVSRISDRKQFVVPLADLEATDKESLNYTLLSDYSYWHVNY
jgi:hypothetical protein